VGQDVEMQALFKNDQFSVEGELARRQREEGAPLLNPSITRERPIFDESIDLGTSLPAGTQQHRFSSRGPAKVQV
jgi:hypothetical protein